ncbi:hypothetical protein J437_LFUL018470 [Ladona fulva]|uniref:Caspase-1 n=1 Tax=Ladona fulva TaxID=123851 RepID=A0A8K0P9D7_LADFU|nr:hypothetical protein J437_LFUL018470 [Ladona fulva]
MRSMSERPIMAKRSFTDAELSENDGGIEDAIFDSGSSIEARKILGNFPNQQNTENMAFTTIKDIDEYDRYNMNHGKRGVALIFNNIHFEKEFINQRHGAELDEQALSETLSNIGFTIRLCRDMTRKEIREELLKVTMEDHSKHDCLFVVIMTHGEENGILHARDVCYRAEEVWMLFRPEEAPSLTGKPKIFLIQACRGTKLEKNAIVIDSTDSGKIDPIDSSPERSLILPSNADFLIAYSSMEGYYSFRNSKEGTWFIQDFCKELRENVYKRDFLSILTRTLRRVAYLRSSYVPFDQHFSGRRQMPVFSSTLTRDIHFNINSNDPMVQEPNVTATSEAGIDEIDRQAINLREQPQIGSITKQRWTQSIEYGLEDFERYEVSHRRRGVALIFNHKIFQSSSVPKRDCADRDGKVLQETLTAFGFNVRMYKDNYLEEIKKVLSDVAKEDHSDCDCFLLVIMTHGEEDGILHAYDDTYKTKDIWDRFTPERVPSLEGKPKIFLFQACRGNKSQLSTEIIDSTDFPSSGKSITPSHADFLIAYSCVEGHYSFKNREGSWFIQDFCKELKSNSERKDILLVLTNTFRRVVHTRKSNIPSKKDVHEKQQIPAFNSTLTKLLSWKVSSELNYISLMIPCIHINTDDINMMIKDETMNYYQCS